jgi:hypothetical protein
MHGVAGLRVGGCDRLLEAQEMPDEEAFADHISLIGDEPNVYEAIATLEFLGKPVTAPGIVSATGLDTAVVRQALRSMAEREVLVETEEHGEPVFEPAHRGWSAAPEQSTGPQR